MESLTDLGDPRRIQPARDEDWESVREAITQLYWTENGELREVMKIMEARHNFHATERQYKTRFKKWKLEKNVDSKRMEAIVRIQKRRREHENKETEFSFRGRPVPQDKIDRWQKQKPDEAVAPPDCLAAPTPSGIEYGTPASLFVSAPSAHLAQGSPSPGSMPDLRLTPSSGAPESNGFTPSAEGNLPVGRGHVASQPFSIVYPPGQRKASVGYSLLERPGSGPLPLPSRDPEIDRFMPVPAWDAGVQNDPLSNEAPQTLLEEGPDPAALIGHAAQMGGYPLWPATINDAEVHAPLQGDASIGENEWMAADDFLHGESNPIDIRGMEINTVSMSFGRRRVGDGPRAASRPETESESCPPRLRLRVVQKGSTFKSSIKLGANASADQGNKIKGTRAGHTEQEGSEFAGHIEASEGAELRQGNEIDGEKAEEGGADKDAEE